MVVPVIEPVLLPAVQFHVRGIDVQHQPLRHLAPLAPHQVQLHEQLVERIEIHGDLARFRRVPPVRRQLVVYKFVCKNEKRTVTTDEWLESDVSSGMWRCLDAIPHPGANHS